MSLQRVHSLERHTTGLFMQSRLPTTLNKQPLRILGTRLTQYDDEWQRFTAFCW